MRTTSPIRACRLVRRAGDLIVDHLRFAHAIFAAFLEICSFLDRVEKTIGLLGERSGERHARSVARDGEKAFLRPRVVEPLDRRAQTVLRNSHADLARSHLFERVRFVEDQEVVREKITFLAFLLFRRRCPSSMKSSV